MLLVTFLSSHLMLKHHLTTNRWPRNAIPAFSCLSQCWSVLRVDLSFIAKTFQSLRVGCIDGLSCAGTVSRVIQTLNWQCCFAHISLRPLHKPPSDLGSPPLSVSDWGGFMAAACDLGPVWVCNALRWMQPPYCQMMNCGLLGTRSAM